MHNETTMHTMAAQTAINDFRALLAQRRDKGFKGFIKDLMTQSEQGPAPAMPSQTQNYTSGSALRYGWQQ